MIKQKYKFVYFLSSMWFLCSIASCSSEITTSSIIKPNFVWTLLKLNWVRKFTSNKSFINFSSTITHKFCALMLFEIFVGLSEMVPLLYFSFSFKIHVLRHVILVYRMKLLSIAVYRSWRTHRSHFPSFFKSAVILSLFALGPSFVSFSRGSHQSLKSSCLQLQRESTLISFSTSWIRPVGGSSTYEHELSTLFSMLLQWSVQQIHTALRLIDMMIEANHTVQKCYDTCVLSVIICQIAHNQKSN